MEYNNKLIDLAKKEGGVDKETLETFVQLLAPFAPHIGEELWQHELGHDGLRLPSSPAGRSYDEEAMKDDEVEIAVQINGKTRARDRHPGGHLQGGSHCQLARRPWATS